MDIVRSRCVDSNQIHSEPLESCEYPRQLFGEFKLSRSIVDESAPKQDFIVSSVS
jgi:hypothetical protein